MRLPPTHRTPSIELENRVGEGNVELALQSAIRHSSSRRCLNHQSHHDVVDVVRVGLETRHELHYHTDAGPRIEQAQHIEQVCLDHISE